MFNKKGNVIGLMGLMYLVAFVSVIVMSIYLIFYGVYNDYLFYDMQETAESLSINNIVTTQTPITTLSFFTGYQGLISSGDNYWFLLYILFVFTTIFYAYTTKTTNEIAFFSFLLYGLVVFMFVTGIIESMTSWFSSEIINNIIPNGLSYFPKFKYFLEHLGIIYLIHASILIIVSKFNFNFSKNKEINNKEVEAIINTDEVT